MWILAGWPAASISEQRRLPLLKPVRANADRLFKISCWGMQLSSAVGHYNVRCTPPCAYQAVMTEHPGSLPRPRVFFCFPTGYPKFHMCEMQRLRVGSVSFLSRLALPRVRTPSSRDNSSALAFPRPGRSLVHQVLGRCVPRGVPVDWWNTRPSVVLTRARIEASKAANQDGCTRAPPPNAMIALASFTKSEPLPTLLWTSLSRSRELLNRE